mgnify:CR=1 FL=1
MGYKIDYVELSHKPQSNSGEVTLILRFQYVNSGYQNNVGIKCLPEEKLFYLSLGLILST